MKHIRWQLLITVIGIAILSVLLGFLALNTRSVERPALGGTYIEGMVGRLNTLNPILSQFGDNDRDVAALLFNGLTRAAEDGTLNVGVGGQEIGQGVFTVAAQMAAAALGVPYESVRIATPVDTRDSPYEWQTVASRLTWSMGNAIVNAAKDARRQILDVVADAWEETPDDLNILNGVVISYKSEKEIPLKNLVIYGLPKPGDSGCRGGPIIGRGNFMPTYVTGLDAETGQGERAVVHYTTGAQAVELEVDLDTGRIEVLKGVSTFDVGKAINPDLVKQ